MTETMTLRRGLAVASSDSDNVKRQILEGGLVGSEGRWELPFYDLKERLNSLYVKPDLTTEDTEDAAEFRGICACADVGGAAYYACKHNRSDKDDFPLVVEFEVLIEDVFVDGRDFLFTAFQLWDSGSSTELERQTQLLAAVFGDAVVRYFQKASSSNEHNYRIAMCRLACQDSAVVRSHAQNVHLIQGRYNTMFRSAFIVRPPIYADSIRSVDSPRYQTASPSLTLSRFLSGEIDELI